MERGPSQSFALPERSRLRDKLPRRAQSLDARRKRWSGGASELPETSSVPFGVVTHLRSRLSWIYLLDTLPVPDEGGEPNHDG